MPSTVTAETNSFDASAGSPLASQDFDSHGRHNADFAWRKSRFDDNLPFLEMGFSEFE